MRQLLRLVLFSLCSTAPALAQGLITVTSSPDDLSRPVSTVIDQIRKQTRASVTYEDPRYANQSDIEDVTNEVSKASDLEKKYGPRILVPKGHAISFVYAPTDMKDLNSAKTTLERLVHEYALAGGPVFAVTQDGLRLHVVPSQALNASGALVRQTSVLETVITVPPARRDGAELLQAICDAVQSKTGFEIGVGPSEPTNNLARYVTRAGITNETAAKAIEDLLDAASSKGIFDWDLYYDPGVKSYGLNFAYVGLASTPEQKANSN